MRSVIAFIKVVLWVPILISYLLSCLFWKLVIHDHVEQRKKYAKTVSFFAKIILWYANTKLTVKNMPPKDQPFLLVGNHLGIMDIMLISSVRNVLFITSVEMKNTPLLGTMAEMGGCLFVERRSRSQMHKEIESIREALKQGFNIVLFPEGTSTNGQALLPFKKALMTAAAGTGVPILPLVLNFTYVNGEKMNWKWRDHVFWYGDHTFLSFLWKAMSLKEVRAEIEFLEPLVCHSEEERRHIAVAAQAQVERKFVPVPLGPEEISTFKLPDALARIAPNQGLGSRGPTSLL